MCFLLFVVLRLMNETTAVALNYGILRPLPEKEAMIVMFVDVGHASTNVALVSFREGELTILGTASDRSVGGRDFDFALVCCVGPALAFSTGPDLAFNTGPLHFPTWSTEYVVSDDHVIR
jgi:molecular chaperone DnaK (HSP70)